MAIDAHVRCDEIVTALGEFLERALGPEETEAVEQHLVICAGCAAYVAQLRTTTERASSLRTPDEPDGPTVSCLRTLFAAHRARDEGEP
jgi:hypothetical protein